MNRLTGEAGLPFNPYWQAFEDEADSMVEEARGLRATGVSHRKKKFLVGGIGLVFEGHGQWTKVPGANNSPYKGSDKSCAEMNIMDHAEIIGGYVAAIVISGPPQRDQVSKYESPTLHPCHACRQKMANQINGHSDEGHSVDAATVVLCVHPKMSVYEIYTAQELLDVHAAAMNKKKRAALRIEPRVYGNLQETKHAFATAHPEIAFAAPPITNGKPANVQSNPFLNTEPL